MFQGLQESQVKGAVEAMLFVTDEPVGTLALADMLECDPALVERACLELREELAGGERGIQLREVAGGWRLFTHPVYHELIEKYVLSWDTRKLSGAAMETLAIIAYTQPVTRAGVASVRGVNSDSAVNSLVEKGLVREAGTADTPGNPTLYATTRGFLEKFGLRSAEDLPDLADFAPDEETRRLITERLSATRAEVGVTDEEARLMAADMAAGDEESFLFDEEALLGEDAAAAAAGALAGGGAVAAEVEVDASGAAVAVVAEAPAGDAPAPGAWRPSEPAAPGAARSPEAVFAEAIASTLGVVDKIDFDALTFETDDE